MPAIRRYATFDMSGLDPDSDIYRKKKAEYDELVANIMDDLLKPQAG